MKTVEHILKSGAKLKITLAEFEKAVSLKEFVDQVILTCDPSWDEEDPRVALKIISTPGIRAFLFPVMDTVLYEGRRVEPALFNDPQIGLKAWGDYNEIVALVIKENRTPFFLRTYSESTTTVHPPTKSPESQ